MELLNTHARRNRFVKARPTLPPGIAKPRVNVFDQSLGSHPEGMTESENHVQREGVLNPFSSLDT